VNSLGSTRRRKESLISTSPGLSKCLWSGKKVFFFFLEYKNVDKKDDGEE
jgi:hypothetical protein